MSDYIDRLDDIRNNPNLMLTLALDHLEQSLNGNYDIPDGTMPFVWAVQNGIMLAAQAIDQGEALMRRLYPQNAITTDELYLHMADRDYAFRFANPALTHMEFLVNKEEIQSKMVSDGSGIKKVVIPRLTSIKVPGDYYFTLQYPVEIKTMRHGGISVVYDVSKPSPLQTLSSNLPYVQEVLFDNKTYLRIILPVYQMRLNSYQEALNPSSPFEAVFSYEDLFFSVRAYIKKGSEWEEIVTTHTEQVFDPNNLTLVLKVLPGKLKVEIPLVYITTGLANGTLRIDLYTTKGKINLDLSHFKQSDFVVDFNSIDDDTVYTAPLKVINEFVAYSPEIVNGGNEAMPFTELRKNVIDGILGPSQIPITGVQLENYFTRKGYKLVSLVDNITDRLFTATRRLPASTVTDTVVSAVGATLSALQSTAERLITLSSVMDNNERITLLPSMLYKYDGGVVSVVLDSEIAMLNSYDNDLLTQKLNEGNYLYSPFHYVLDVSSSNFDVRPYYLDNPSIQRKTYVGENDTSGYAVSIDTYQIERIAEGYRITIKTKSSEAFKNLGDSIVTAQIGYKPIGENNFTGLNGVMIGKEDNERIFQFDIKTRFDIDSNGRLMTTNLSMYDPTQVRFGLGLEHDLEITFIILNMETIGYTKNALDYNVQSHLLTSPFMCPNREALTVRFGWELTDLWRRNRTVVTEESYQHYASNIPAYYQEDVYKRDAQGNIEITLSGGNIQYTILHHKGDPILDSNGNPVWLHQKGDTVLDSNGKPVLVEPRKILREFTLFLIDGRYYFVTEDSAIRYKNEVPMQIVNWLNDDIKTIRSRLLERCEAYLAPLTTYGNTEAFVGDGLSATIRLNQALNVQYYLTPSVYKNLNIRPNIIRMTKEIIAEHLSQTTVIRSDIISSLKLAMGEDVLGIEVKGLGGESDFDIVTLKDHTTGLSIKKKLVSLTNQSLTVEDDINISFLRH